MDPETKEMTAMPTKHHHRLFAALGLALAVSLAAAAGAQADDALPGAREVVDRFVEAIGGAERLQSRTSVAMTGSFKVPAQGIEGGLQLWTQAPDRMLLEVEIPGYGKVRSGFDGTVAWMMDPAMGAQVLADKSAAQMRDQANFYSSLYRAEDYESLEVVGRADFQDTACWELAVVSSQGLASRHFFAVDGGLLLGMTQTQFSPMGEIPSTTALKEYREFEGLKLPTVLEQSMLGMQQITTIATVSFAPIEAAVFALPADIAALTTSEE
jgi:hypothetical protein